MCDLPRVTWTISEIESHWFPGEQQVELPPDAVEAITVADQVHGREWVMNSTNLPNGGRSFGFASFLGVYLLGKRVAIVRGSDGFEKLVARLRQNDRAAHSELAAIDLLHSRRHDLGTEIEFEPEVAVGDRIRHPDFRIRCPGDSWTYVEVTQLHRSNASNFASTLLHRLCQTLMAIPHAFILEVILLRYPSAAEETKIVQLAHDLCQTADEQRRHIEHVAWLVRKPDGDASSIVPMVIEGDSEPRMAMAQASRGAGAVDRQVIVRIPFADQRAEDVLTAEAKQLPKNESGLVMIDVTGQPTALDSWPPFVTRRFTPKLNTRIAGVCLFMHAIHGSSGWMSTVKLVTNPHARVPVAPWIMDVVGEIREESKRRSGRPD